MEYAFCQYEDCDQFPEAGETQCAAHLLAAERERVRELEAALAAARGIIREQRATITGLRGSALLRETFKAAF